MHVYAIVRPKQEECNVYMILIAAVSIQILQYYNIKYTHYT